MHLCPSMISEVFMNPWWGWEWGWGGVCSQYTRLEEEEQDWRRALVLQRPASVRPDL